jgi:hypothetical protein
MLVLATSFFRHLGEIRLIYILIAETKLSGGQVNFQLNKPVCLTGMDYNIQAELVSTKKLQVVSFGNGTLFTVSAKRGQFVSL